jgi:hypothetical protein
MNMPPIARRNRRTAPLEPEINFTMPEVLFLFGRRPSDIRWLESADRAERLMLEVYFLKRLRPDRGA